MYGGSLTREEVVWWHTPELRLRREAFQKYLDRGEDWCKGGEHAIRNHISYTSFRSNGDGLGPVGDLPVLYFSRGSWRLWSTHSVDELFEFETGWHGGTKYFADRSNWENGRLKPNYFTGPNDPTINTLDRVLWVANDPRTFDLDELKARTTDDTVRFVRFVQTAFTRFVVDDEPTVPSIWKEGDQLLCGWNSLYPEDGRVMHPALAREAQDWYGAKFIEPDGWRWRVPK